MLTLLVTHDGVAAGYIQGGFDLTLHDRQARSLMLAVLLVGALGLVAAAAIAYVVTGRALVPIRQGFEASAASWRMPRTSSGRLPPSSAPTPRCWSASGSWRTAAATAR